MATNTNSEEQSTGGKTIKWDILVIDPRRCVGCEICESVCSFAHDGEFNPVNSRINRVRIEPVINSTINCLKCYEPECVEACDLNALSQDPKTGLIIIDENLCDGCGACVKDCPFGAVTLHSKTNKALMCDLCVGTKYDEPQCKEYCPKEAIFIETIVSDEDADRMDTLRKILNRGFEGDGMLN